MYGGDVQSAEKKYEVSNFTIYFNTPKDQEAMLFYECVQGPQDRSLVRLFPRTIHRNQKSCILMLYYNEMMLIKIRKRKRHIEQSPGETKHMFSSACAVIEIELSDSSHIKVYDIVPARELHLGLGVWDFYWR